MGADSHYPNKPPRQQLGAGEWISPSQQRNCLYWAPVGKLIIFESRLSVEREREEEWHAGAKPLIRMLETTSDRGIATCHDRLDRAVMRTKQNNHFKWSLHNRLQSLTAKAKIILKKWNKMKLNLINTDKSYTTDSNSTSLIGPLNTGTFCD